MGMHGLDSLVSGLFVTFASMLLGGLFVVLALIADAFDADAFEPSYDKRWRVPAALYALIAASFLDLAGYILLLNVPSELPGYGVVPTVLFDRVWSGLLITDFVLVLISMVLAFRHTGLGRRTLLVGSIVLFVINILGFIIYL
jgi:hypothetical protein